LPPDFVFVVGWWFCGMGKKLYLCILIFILNAMVIEIDRTVTPTSLKHLLDHVRETRAQRKKPNLTEFFGALPNIGDGLEFQKKVRDEWN
jgi:hypothetical protein